MREGPVLLSSTAGSSAAAHGETIAMLPRGAVKEGSISRDSTSAVTSSTDEPVASPSQNTSAEASLFECACCGDTEAVSALWSLHRRWVAVVLLAHKPAAVDLDDLMQDVAITLMVRIGDVRSSDGLRPWLRMVAVNAARAAARSARVRTTESIHGRGALPSPETDDAAGARSDDAELLLALAGELPETYREPLLLRCLQELSTRQIAELLDLPETTIETRVSRARRMVRERMATIRAAESATRNGPP